MKPFTFAGILRCCLLLLATIGSARAADQFRTDINPALLYYRAFLLTPNSSQELDYLNDAEKMAGKLPDKYGELIGEYDNQLGLIRQAAQCSVPCDWGVDMSPGPGTLLPHLARVKGAIVAGRRRALWELQNGRQSEAKDDLLAALTLARNGARDGTLISMLVQIAGEN